MSEVTPRLETRSAQPALIQRHVVPMAEVAQAMQAALPAAFGACQANGLTIAGPPLTRYPEMAGQTCTLEAGIPITERVDAPDGLDVIETTGGEVAVFVHKGSYQTLGHTWSKAFGRIRAAQKVGGDGVMG